MNNSLMDNLQRAKDLLAAQQYAGVEIMIDRAIEIAKQPTLTYTPHCPETCKDPGGYCECQSELNNGE